MVMELDLPNSGLTWLDKAIQQLNDQVSKRLTGHSELRFTLSASN